MNIETPIYSAVLPEIVLLSAACLVLVVDVFLSDRQRWVTYTLAQLGMLGTAVTAWLTFPDARIVTFSGSYVADPLSAVIKIAVALLVSLAFLYSWAYLKQRNMVRGEYYMMGMFAALGMLVMASAHSLLSLYLGLELLSLSMYGMVAYDRDSAAGSEAAMKYFVLGALASGMLLYGMSMVYGSTGTIDMGKLAELLKSGALPDKQILLYGVVFLVVGVAFKFGAVPFHMWVPDVYQGAPLPTTLFIGTAPKLAAFAMVMRMLVEGLAEVQGDWQTMLYVLILLSLFLGNVVAIAQTNIKRMLAYSTISHVGFLLMGVVAGGQEGYAAALFYAITYAVTAAAAFAGLMLLSRAGVDCENIDDLRGLNQRSPWFALVMAVVLFSLGGFPPTIGFYGKLLVLKAAINVDLYWLVFAAVTMAVVGAYYYLRVVKAIYFDEAEDRSPLLAAGDFRLALSLNGVLVLGAGLFPGPLIQICISAMQGLPN
jgi:NADH-quinone oxidoreductase subunit N